MFQILAPNIINKATNTHHRAVASSTSRHRHALFARSVIELVVLGVLAGITGLVSRYFMYRTAYDIEFDLRNLIYEHLSTLSFGFYDRVQSGQLISRANSDIRSVQMYTMFAPLILVQCSIGVIAFGFMLYYSPLLAIVALAMMPLLYCVGVRMRKHDVPDLLGHPGAAGGRRHGRRRERQRRPRRQVLRPGAGRAHKLGDAAKKRRVGATSKTPTSAAEFTPWVQNLPQIGLALVLGIGGWLVINGHLNIGEILAFNLYFGMLQAPFMMLGQLVMMGQRAKASAERIFEILDEQTEITERPGRRRPRRCQRTRRLPPRDFAYSRRHPDLRRTSASTSRPASPSRSSGRPARASPRSHGSSTASTT